MNQLEKLLAFQKLEECESNLRADLQSLPQKSELRELKKEIEFQQNELKMQKEDIDKMHQKHRQLESLVNEARIELKEVSEMLFSGEIVNLKELESCDNRRKYLEENVDKIEDSILSGLEWLDQCKIKFKKLNDGLRERKEQYRRILRKYNLVKEKINSGLEMAAEQKMQLEAQIDKKIMKEYNEMKLKYTKKDYIVEVKSQICQGCYMTVPFDLVRSIRSEGFAKCDHCGRILLNNNALG